MISAIQLINSEMKTLEQRKEQLMKEEKAAHELVLKLEAEMLEYNSDKNTKIVELEVSP